LNDISLRQSLRVGLVVFLIFPFLFLLTQFRISFHLDWGEFFWALKNSFVQAFLSAVLSLLFGFWAALGLLCFSNGHRKHWRMILEVLCLAPNFLPPIFVLLAALNVVDPFPMGIAGITLVHTLMNFGLVAVLLASLIEVKMGGVVELAYIEGASRFRFIRDGLYPMLRKDIYLLGLFIFVICFSSFAVPLIVGGGRGTTLEVLIYEKIRLASDWGSAVFLALVQSALIFGLSFYARQGQAVSSHRPATLRLLMSPSGVGFILLISALYLIGYFQGLWAGIGQIANFYELQGAIFYSFFGSLFVGVVVGGSCFILLMLIAFAWPKLWFEKFLNGYVAPSTALACFSFLILGPNEGVIAYLKIPVALTMLYLTSLFRMGWQSSMQALEHQRSVAYIMGASPILIFRKVIFPQVCERAGMLAGIAAIWGCGDFAASRVLGHHDFTIAMMTETLMSSYRLGQATILSMLIVVAGLMCFAFFVGGSRVLRRKLST
jgi:thiamine transport system permease protein